MGCVNVGVSLKIRSFSFLCRENKTSVSVQCRLYWLYVFRANKNVFYVKDNHHPYPFGYKNEFKMLMHCNPNVCYVDFLELHKILWNVP